jgi:transcriptional regulator with XRE-family HTH domain
MRQADFAAKLGYEQSYISAIELGKGPPSREFIDRITARLQLSDTWEARLRAALDESQRKIILPVGASEDMYKLFNELRRQVDTLRPVQLELIQIALRLPDTLTTGQLPPALPPRRQGSIDKKKPV